jgi:glutathione S-transferase
MIPFESYRPAVPFDWSPYSNINAYFDRVRKMEHWVRTAPASPASFDLRETVLAQANA